MVKSKSPETKKPPHKELAIGRIERPPHHLLPGEYALLRRVLDEFDEEKRRQGSEMGVAMAESSETDHDNAPAEAIQSERGNLVALVRPFLDIHRRWQEVEFPDPDSPFIALGSRVEITQDLHEPFLLDLVGFSATFHPSQLQCPEADLITDETPLAMALVGHKAGDVFDAEIVDRTVRIDVISVDQLSIARALQQAMAPGVASA